MLCHGGVYTCTLIHQQSYNFVLNTVGKNIISTPRMETIEHNLSLEIDYERCST